MMIKNIFFKRYLMVILSVLMPNILLANQYMSTIQQNRQNHQSEFVKQARTIKTCEEMLTNLSVKAKNITDTALKRTDTCKSPVTTRDRYYQCVDLTKKIIANTNTLHKEVMDAKNVCSGFTFSNVVADRITQSVSIVKSNLQFMGDEGLGFWVNSFKKSEKNIYDKYKPLDCSMDIGRVSPYIAFSMGMASVAYSYGDIYNLNKSLSELNIARDYVSTIADVCTAEGFNFPKNDKNAKKWMEDGVKNIHTQVTRAKKEIDDVVSEYSNSSFEELSKKACTRLQVQNKNTYGLCEAPVNTPEWAYSIHSIIMGDINAEMNAINKE